LNTEPNLATIRAILDSIERRKDTSVPSQRYQDPDVETRSDVKRPFYFIRAHVPTITANGLKRKRTPLRLGFVDEMTMRQAKQRKAELLATLNNGKLLVQSQVPFKLYSRA
jgi:hypothetical protein